MTEQPAKPASEHFDVASAQRGSTRSSSARSGNLGVGLPYAITVSVFGGTAPAIALNLKSIGHEEWFYYYLAGIICLSLIIYSTMRDTKHASAMHRHE